MLLTKNSPVEYELKTITLERNTKSEAGKKTLMEGNSC